MTEPAVSTCEPWATEADLCSPCSEYESVMTEDLPWALQAASDVLFRLSGRQFPGICQATVRPCSRSRGDRWPAPAGWTGSWGFCGCSRDDRCGCGSISSIALGGSVEAVSEVKVDGEVLDAGAYRVDNHRWLVRTDGDAWPCCQRLDREDTELETFSVTYSYGRTPPPMGVRAAAVLACELAMACHDETVGQCRLPRSVSAITRQGVTMVITPADVLAPNGKVGIHEVDLFIQAYNPSRLQRRATVLSPDTSPTARRVNT